MVIALSCLLSRTVFSSDRWVGARAQPARIASLRRFRYTWRRVKPRGRARWRRLMPQLMKILTCNSNRPLAEAISACLGLPLTRAAVRRFSDMEVFVEIHENVRGEDVFVVQSTSYPANDNLMELLVTLDALKRGSARRTTAVIPYYGYARQDRKSGPRTPISAKLVANMITAAGADRVLTLDLHAGQIQGFFDIPTDNLYAAPVFIKDIKERYNGEDLVVVSPDVAHGVLSGGAVARVSASPMELLITTDSILATEAVRVAKNIRQLTIAPLMAEAIRRISDERSVSSLFD